MDDDDDFGFLSSSTNEKKSVLQLWEWESLISTQWIQMQPNPSDPIYHLKLGNSTKSYGELEYGILLSYDNFKYFYYQLFSTEQLIQDIQSLKNITGDPDKVWNKINSILKQEGKLEDRRNRQEPHLFQIQQAQDTLKLKFGKEGTKPFRWIFKLSQVPSEHLHTCLSIHVLNPLSCVALESFQYIEKLHLEIKKRDKELRESEQHFLQFKQSRKFCPSFDFESALGLRLLDLQKIYSDHVISNSFGSGKLFDLFFRSFNPSSVTATYVDGSADIDSGSSISSTPVKSVPETLEKAIDLTSSSFIHNISDTPKKKKPKKLF